MNCKYLRDNIYCNYPDKDIRESEAPDGICIDEVHQTYQCGMWEEGPLSGWVKNDQVR